MKQIIFRVIKYKKIDLPLIVWVVVGSTFIATAGEFSVLGRAIAGWAWVIPLVVSLYFISKRTSLITFPVIIWAPWICIIITYFIISSFSYIQRSVMLLSPIIVGIATSTMRIREIQINGFLVLIKVLIIALFITIIVKTGLLFTGILPGAAGFGPQSTTAALLCTVSAVGYSLNRKEYLKQWIIGALIPVIALTRSAILAAFLTLPLTFASLSLRKRLIFLGIVAIVGVNLFYTERVQRKMFYSGSGGLQDIRLSNPDFFTTGRSRLWNLMIEEIKTKPIWGHGPNASEEFVSSKTWGTLTHPHNDWLRLLYDYGLIGTSIFAFCLLAQVVHLLRRAKNAFGESRILLYAGASSFLPFILVMSTDNIILYAAFFGNLQFTMLGLVYAARKTKEIDAWRYFQMSSLALSPNSQQQRKNLFNHQNS